MPWRNDATPRNTMKPNATKVANLDGKDGVLHGVHMGGHSDVANPQTKTTAVKPLKKYPLDSIANSKVKSLKKYPLDSTAVKSQTKFTVPGIKKFNPDQKLSNNPQGLKKTNMDKPKK